MVIFSQIDSALAMTRLIIRPKLSTKQKCDPFAKTNDNNKPVKQSQTFIITFLALFQ